MNPNLSMYERTAQENGTFISRCLYCFMKINAEGLSETEIDALEAKHLCPERALIEQRLLKQKTESEAGPN